MDYIFIDESEIEPDLVDAAKKIIRFADKDILSDSESVKLEDLTIKWFVSARYAARFFGKREKNPDFCTTYDYPVVAMVTANEPGVIRMLSGTVASVKRGVVSVAVHLMMGYSDVNVYMSDCHPHNDPEIEKIDKYIAESLHRYAKAEKG